MNQSLETRGLRLWQRLLLAALPANLVVYACLLGWGLSFPELLRDLPAGRNSGPGELYIVVGVIYFSIGTVLTVMALSVTVCTLFAGFRRWKHWYTAVAGGLVAAAFGMVVGALGLAAIVRLI
jgi:hypothetical protein